ncbi:MAG: 50S ribosomal protein L5 [Candidatus Diapherotrites archaeon]|nr:50S ribosomal protein L5 [Candidatus Diapherotrites archaeon]
MQENAMRNVRVFAVTVNMGVGESGEELKKAQQIIEKITGSKSVQTLAKVKQPTWNLKPGLPIGTKVTLRGKKAQEFLKQAFQAKDNKIMAKSFDRAGNFGFGISEYIDLPQAKYDPKLGIRGLDVLVSLEKPGYRVKRRKRKKAVVGKRQLVSKEEAMAFLREKFGVDVQ